MLDCRFAGLRVALDAFMIPKQARGDGEVQRRSEGAVAARAQRNTYAGAQFAAVRGGMHAAGEPSDRGEPGARAGGRAASLITPTSGSSSGVVDGGEVAVAQAAGGGQRGLRLIDRAVDVGMGRRTAGRLVRVLCTAPNSGGAGGTAWACQTSGLQDARSSVRHRGSWPGDSGAGRRQKTCRAKSLTFFLMDESGRSERPTWITTCAPRGRVPVMPYSINWKQPSLIVASSPPNASAAAASARALLLGCCAPAAAGTQDASGRVDLALMKPVDTPHRRAAIVVSPTGQRPTSLTKHTDERRLPSATTRRQDSR
jgi:hypothetical protein